MLTWLRALRNADPRGAGWLTILLLAAVFSPNAAYSQTPDEESESIVGALSWGYESDCSSRYVWRGLRFSEGGVEKTSAWATVRGTTFGVWLNTNLEAVDGRHTNEIDYYVSREFGWRRFTVEPSFQYYTYRHQEDAPSTGELSAKFSLPAGRFSLFTNQTFDVIEYAGAYFGDVGLSYTGRTGPHTEMECAVAMGWGSGKFNAAYIGPSKWALNVASLDIGFTYSAANGAYIRPHISYTRLLDGELRDSVEKASTVNFGIALGMEF